MSELRPVEPLDPKRHRTDEFDSGQPSLDRWVRFYAGQSQRRDVARTFVTSDAKFNVVGYYTLVAGEVEQAAASSHVRAGVSKHFPIPVCLIARLAVDRSWQGRGLGRDLLRDAMRRTLAASDQIGIRAVVVDAIDEEAARFYRRRGFEPATDDELTLMVPIAALRSQFAS
ncbi:MAG: GNAT family N-acetyltransferase [Solirubrobacteraceae bacterium]